MLKILLSILLFLLFSNFSAAYAQDSTKIRPQSFTPLKPKTVLDTNACQNAPVLTANFLVNNGKTGNKWLPAPVQSNCPEDLQPYGFKTYVGMVGGSGVFEWQFYCCKTKVVYTS